MIISKRNQLADLTVSDITAPTAALGYSETDLIDSAMARVFKTSSSATFHEFTFDNVSGNGGNLCAVFDAHPGAGSITSIQFYADGVLMGSGSVGVRGDGAVLLDAVEFPATWKVRFNLSASTTLTVGEIWIGGGLSTYTPRNPTAIRVTRQRAVVVNGDYASQSEPYRTRITLPFDRTLAADHAAFVDTYDDLLDGTEHFVLIPDEDVLTNVYLGRMVNDPTWEIDFPTYGNHSIEFLEARRSIGA